MNCLYLYNMNKMDNINHQKEFLEYCKAGNIQVLREYYNNYYDEIFQNREDNDKYFRTVCEAGFLEGAQFLYENVPDIDVSSLVEYPFRYACVNGHLRVAQWLVSIKPEIKVDIWNNYAFFSCCCTGHLDVLKWLYVMSPTLNVASSPWTDEKKHSQESGVPNYEAFRMACEYGHLDVVKWLLELNPDTNISECDEYAFRWSCGNGHLHVVRYLLELKPDINMRALKEQVLFMACRNGKYEAVEFLLGARDDWKLNFLPRFLDKKMVSIINRYVFKKMTWMKTVISNELGEDCSICLCASDEGRRTPCGHYYCRDCIGRWAISNHTCPYCREYLFVRR